MIVSPPGAARPISARSVTVSIAVLIASLACGYGFYRLSKPHHPTMYAAPLAATPAPPLAATTAVAPEAAQATQRIPERVPELTLPGPDGTLHKLSKWSGRPLLVNFWATWCEPCRREIPLLKSLRRENVSKRLEIVGIAIDHRASVRKYIRDNHVDYPILVGEQGGFEAAAAFGMDTVLPFSVFADARGRIVALKVGELHRDEAELILDRIGKLEAGSLSLQAARDEISAAMAALATSRHAPGPERSAID